MTRAAEPGRWSPPPLATYGSLDVLLNNAGITIPGSYTHDVQDDDWARIIAVDLTGAFLMMKHAIPAMLQSGGGSIVNVSSVLALAGIPGCSAYAAAKAGLIGLTRTAAIEYAQQGIRVNVLLPGFVWTPMHHGADPAAADPSQAPRSDYLRLHRKQRRADGPLGNRRGNRPDRAVPGRRRLVLRHGEQAGRRRRAAGPLKR